MDLAYFFGMPACLNDINLVKSLQLLSKIALGEYPKAGEYKIPNIQKNKRYWSSDDICLRWPVFTLATSNIITKKQYLFKKMQGAVKNDIESAFGVLQAK